MNRLKSGLISGILAGLNAAAASPSVAMDANAVPAVQAAVERAIEPIIANEANAEPWFRSRVTWGAIVSVAVPALSALGVATEWLQADELVALLTATGATAGGALTLYGRWRAKRTIGAGSQ
ncbi:hypothetical protein FPY71_11525 [Aureimonas fodinaquatilis]|uniref:Holin n=1 Tax=Aureimonas fodinaquatilis TaxID=2565783 RepID=A0A5B0DXJ1_9HYPH|nr:hypothetical protein [Aureimonas fodinaquatilis]KAA0971068.1 hypothetical protein FPY71_11525 [Aureimonas fodinaquatilis]